MKKGSRKRRKSRKGRRKSDKTGTGRSQSTEPGIRVTVTKRGKRCKSGGFHVVSREEVEETPDPFDPSLPSSVRNRRKKKKKAAKSSYQYLEHMKKQTNKEQRTHVHKSILNELKQQRLRERREYEKKRKKNLKKSRKSLSAVTNFRKTRNRSNHTGVAPKKTRNKGYPNRNYPRMWDLGRRKSGNNETSRHFDSSKQRSVRGQTKPKKSSKYLDGVTSSRINFAEGGGKASNKLKKGGAEMDRIKGYEKYKERIGNPLINHHDTKEKRIRRGMQMTVEEEEHERPKVEEENIILNLPPLSSQKKSLVRPSSEAKSKGLNVLPGITDESNNISQPNINNVKPARRRRGKKKVKQRLTESTFKRIHGRETSLIKESKDDVELSEDVEVECVDQSGGDDMYRRKRDISQVVKKQNEKKKNGEPKDDGLTSRRIENRKNRSNLGRQAQQARKGGENAGPPCPAQYLSSSPVPNWEARADPKRDGVGMGKSGQNGKKIKKKTEGGGFSGWNDDNYDEILKSEKLTGERRRKSGQATKEEEEEEEEEEGEDEEIETVIKRKEPREGYSWYFPSPSEELSSVDPISDIEKKKSLQVRVKLEKVKKYRKIIEFRGKLKQQVFRNIDLVFLVDLCGTRMIDMVRQSLKNLTNLITKKMGCKLRIGFVGYKNEQFSHSSFDFSRITKFRLTPNIEDYELLFKQVNTSGGNYQTSDCISGLREVSTLNWSSEYPTRMVIHLTSRPCYGKQFCSEYIINHEERERNEEFIEGMDKGMERTILKLREKRIQYFFFIIPNSSGKVATKKMIKSFDKVYSQVKSTSKPIPGAMKLQGMSRADESTKIPNMFPQCVSVAMKCERDWIAYVGQVPIKGKK